MAKSTTLIRLLALLLIAVGGQSSLYAQVTVGKEWTSDEVRVTPVPHGQDWFLTEVFSEKEQVMLLRLGEAEMAYVNDHPLAAPLNPVLVRKGKNLLWVKTQQAGGPDVQWEQPPGPVFFDVDGVVPKPWNPELEGAAQDLLVINATLEAVPMLTLVCGGVGPFQRKRLPIWTGMPPLSVTRVSAPLLAKASLPTIKAGDEFPLFLSAGGIVGVDPLIQSIRIPYGNPQPVYTTKPPTPEPADSWQAKTEQFRLKSPYPDLGPDNTQLPRPEGPAVLRSIFFPDQKLLTLRMNEHARLVRVKLDPQSGIEEIVVAGENPFLPTSVADLGGLGRHFWIEWDGANWKFHRHGVPASHKGLHRRGPVPNAMADAVWVYGTAGSVAENDHILRRLRLDGGAWLSSGPSNQLQMVSDREFLTLERQQEFAGRNLVVLGNADTNLAWKQLAATDMPLRFARGVLEHGLKRVESDGYVGVSLQPRLTDPYALVLFLGDTGGAGVEVGYGLRPERMTDLDYQVEWTGLDYFYPPHKEGRFDHRWRFPEQPDLAEQE